MRESSGFTIVEVLIAMTIVATIAAAIAPLFAIATADVRDAKIDTIALFAATQKMEQLRAGPVTAGETGVETLADRGLVRRWSVQPSAADPTDTLILSVTVDAAGHGPGHAGHVMLVSLRTRHAS
jgi:type II secretion system protein I